MDPWLGMLSIRIQVNTYVQRKQREETPISTPLGHPAIRIKMPNSSPDTLPLCVGVGVRLCAWLCVRVCAQERNWVRSNPIVNEV